MDRTSRPVIGLVDCGSRKTGSIREALESAGAGVEVVALGGVSDQSMAGWDGVVVSGGPHLFTDPANAGLRERFAFLDHLNTPVLGICLGHQAIAARHGGAPFRGSERRGPEAVRITGPHPLFEGLKPETVFGEDHCEGVPLPSGFRCLAVSDHYDNEAMVSADGREIGVQFHPEISGEAGERLLANFVAIVAAGAAGR